MCGIAGYVGSRGRLPDEKVERAILDALQSRGPDDEGRWVHPEKKALFLHRRLSIQDLSPSGAQPMTTADGRFTLVFNGEIYNAGELREKVPDYPFVGTSDTECILALYQSFGPRMLDFLRGMYAFAIWDDVESTLFLARDPYGIKPLYIAQTPDGFWFASQVKALLLVPGVDVSPAPAGHAGFFLWGSVPEPYTLYKGIRSLRAGHSLRLRAGENSAAEISQFASLAGVYADASATESENPARTSLQDALHESVKLHFVSDVPVAVFLSAGLDSSTILGIAADAFPAGELKALTLGFDAYQNTAGDESAEASQVAKHYGVPQRTRMVSQVDFASETQRILKAMDQPTIDGINTYFVAKMAREAGFKVALSGVGGDELFGGYGSFRQIPSAVAKVRSLGVPHGLAALFRRCSHRILGKFTSPKYAGILEYGNTVEGAYLLRRALFMPWDLAEVLHPDMAAAGLKELDEDEFETKELDKIRHLPLYAQVAFLESAHYLRNQLLRDADWAGMAHSVEIRTPLVDFFLLRQLAPLVGSRRPPNKRDMAAAPVKPLPARILNRKKTGFAVPVRDWLTSSLPNRPERGLRSWAKFVYQEQWGGCSGTRIPQSPVLPSGSSTSTSEKSVPGPV